jgi:hypothetical protein
MHLQGQARGPPDGAAEDPRRPVDGLHAGGRAGLPRDRRRARGRPAADDQGQHGRDRHRRHGGARPRRHRAGGGAAGDGGQGGAVQAVRRRRRLAGLPRHHRRRRDRAHRRGDRAGLRRASTSRTSPRPRCFEIEERLRESLDIPVFHDDQHGTAIVVLAPCTTRCGWSTSDSRTSPWRCPVPAPPGSRSPSCCCARGSATSSSCRPHGIIGTDDATGSTRPSGGSPSTPTATGSRARCATRSTAPTCSSACPARTCSTPRTSRDGDDPIVFALANPDPEVDPVAAREHAAVVATGRSDYPNQINNVLAFPGVFRGALDARARRITEDMKVAAARRHRRRRRDDELRPTYIIPSVFNGEPRSSASTPGPAVDRSTRPRARSSRARPRCRSRTAGSCRSPRSLRSTKS